MSCRSYFAVCPGRPRVLPCAAHQFRAAAQAVTLEAERDYAAGEDIAMDYGVGKLDSQVLLDHGVLDTDNPQACLLRPCVACFLQLGPA